MRPSDIIIPIGIIIAFALFSAGIIFVSAHHTESIPTPTVDPSNSYGCPGCPSSFMDFAQDMCHRMGSTYTVTDGENTLKCSEITGSEL